MRPEGIREMSDPEMTEKLGELSEELFQLRLRAAYEELENPMLIRHLRRDIARLETIKREREATAGPAEAS